MDRQGDAQQPRSSTHLGLQCFTSLLFPSPWSPASSPVVFSRPDERGTCIMSATHHCQHECVEGTDGQRLAIVSAESSGEDLHPLC
jgi:hypothetical protein